jgi:hypothetical protein
MSRRQIARSDVQVTPSRPANRTRLNTQVTGHLNWLIRAQQQDSGRNLCPCGVTRLVLAETTARQETLAGPAVRQRATALALASAGQDPGHPDTAEAAAYPETIKLAGMLLAAPDALPAGPE